MLSYQHIYHAGNPADVHKHALLAWMLARMTEKPKPLSYIETHAGRGLYDLGSDAALKTGEAAAGIERLEQRLTKDHPYREALTALRAEYGPRSYPGSPLLAAQILRPEDRLHLCELHPQEGAALTDVMGRRAKIHAADGFETAFAICPPSPRRGLMLIDPSWELKSDYQRLPDIIRKLHRAWNVGVIALWYPILTDRRHDAMLSRLDALALPDSVRSEVAFPPVRAGHRMIGSGLFVVNAPWGLKEQSARISELFS